MAFVGLGALVALGGVIGIASGAVLRRLPPFRRGYLRDDLDQRAFLMGWMFVFTGLGMAVASAVVVILTAP